jgi:DNA invertase Pin-like site-specific DNA recombinase
MAFYGYARCSTGETKQDVERQVRELKEQGATKVFSEYIGGAKNQKPELERLLEVIETGDTVAVTEVSRLARDVHQLCHILDVARERRVRLLCGSVTLNFDSDDVEPMSIAMVQIMGVFAQLERGVTVARINSGIRNAKSKGTKIGRPPHLPPGRPYRRFRPNSELYRRKVINCRNRTCYGLLTANYIQVPPNPETR